MPRKGHSGTSKCRRPVEALAERLGVRLLSHGSLHLLTRRPVTTWAFRMATDARLALVLNKLRRRPSLVARDVAALQNGLTGHSPTS